MVLSATGGSERHALVLDHGLRPLFAFFSADIIATGIYATEADFADYRPHSATCSARIERGCRRARAGGSAKQRRRAPSRSAQIA